MDITHLARAPSTWRLSCGSREWMCCARIWLMVLPRAGTPHRSSTSEYSGCVRNHISASDSASRMPFPVAMSCCAQVAMGRCAYARQRRGETR